MEEINFSTSLVYAFQHATRFGMLATAFMRLNARPARTNNNCVEKRLVNYHKHTRAIKIHIYPPSSPRDKLQQSTFPCPSVSNGRAQLQTAHRQRVQSNKNKIAITHPTRGFLVPPPPLSWYFMALVVAQWPSHFTITMHTQKTQNSEPAVRKWLDIIVLLNSILLALRSRRPCFPTLGPGPGLGVANGVK